MMSCSPARVTTSRTVPSSACRFPTATIWLGWTNRPLTLADWSARPIQPLSLPGAAHGRKIAGREAQKRIVAGEPRHDDLADLALGGGIVRAGRDDLDDEVVVDQHAGHEPAAGVVGLPGDHPEVGGGVGLPRVDFRRLRALRAAKAGAPRRRRAPSRATRRRRRAPAPCRPRSSKSPAGRRRRWVSDARSRRRVARCCPAPRE